MSTPNPRTELTEQNIQNLSFDPEFDVLAVEMLGYDSANNRMVRVKTDTQGTQQTSSQTYAQKLTESGNILYFAEAAVGSSTASAVWRVRKVDDDTGLTTWADGNANFDNVASDLTALTYS